MILRCLTIVSLSCVLGCSGRLASQQGANITAPNTSTATNPAGAKKSDVSLKTLSHDEITQLIASHKGKVVVVDCWSTQCGPCLKEFPKLVAMHKEYGDKVACVSLSFDYEGFGKPEERVPDVLAFLEEQGATFDNVISSDDSETLYKKFGFVSIPVVLVYGPDGKLAQQFDNEDVKKAEDAFSYKDVDALVSELVKK